MIRCQFPGFATFQFVAFGGWKAAVRLKPNMFKTLFELIASGSEFALSNLQLPNFKSSRLFMAVPFRQKIADITRHKRVLSLQHTYDITFPVHILFQERDRIPPYHLELFLTSAKKP
jgi:hypothetical protein